MVDLSQFKLRVNIKASVEDAYRAWTTPMGLHSWFIGKMVFTTPEGAVRRDDELVQPGDTYACYWVSDPQKIVVQGKVLKANGKNLYSFSFARDVPVTISIYTEHNETIVELIESNLAMEEGAGPRQFVSDSKGWIFYLTNLKSVLEGGLDLRNRNEAIRNVITH